jgi:ABC-type glycerol-3-phosphate transport system substrate-binding protein
MSTELEWNSPDSDSEASPPPPDRPTSRRWPWILVALFVACGFVLLLLNWFSRPVDQKLLRAVELYVEAEKRAVAAGDDAIFFSMQAEDPAWRAIQIGLARDLAQADSVEVIDLEEHGDQIWAILRSMHNGSPIQHQAFFQWDGDRLLHVASDPDFWGSMETQPYTWGRLQLHRSDREWGEMVGEFVATKMETLCRDGCIEERLRFNVTLGSDHSATAVPGVVRLPSPRLIGLDGVGKPSPLFWKRLANELEAYLRPAEIRFAAPDDIADRLQSSAADFTVQYPEINVKVIPFSQLPAEADQMLSVVDGAYLHPEPTLIASDRIHDLTSWAETDPTADIEDYYGPVLAGSRWRDRLWALPLSAEMSLVYYDEPSFEVATLSPENYLSQIWQHAIRSDSDPLGVLRTESDGWGFLDSGPNSLYAYAFSLRCEVDDAQPCDEPLRQEDLAAALTWYYAHVVQDGNMPDLTGMDEKERAFSMLNWLSIPREVPMWVDLPGFYEHTDQLGSVGVLPLQAQTGADKVKGPTPLQIQSGVISRASDNPAAVWTWLNYLSHQRPIGPVRSIPARRSVAEQINYWETLPPELHGPMSEAFTVARAVGIAEEPYFGWSDLADLVNGSAEPEALAEQMMETIWFQFD